MKTCKTKYPILLVHGIAARDRERPGYWGRIPKALEARGARVFFGNQDSWGSIDRNAKILRETLEKVLAETGCEKVNIIAHSKGGLESRYLAASLGCAAMIASITTISTPHRGSRTMDVIWRFPKPLLRLVSGPANLWFRLLGDRHPDFYGACEQLTTSSLEAFNRKNPDMPGILYQSFASVMRHAFSDIIVCVPYLVIRQVEGKNDGIVAMDSARWANFRGVWRGSTGRGISHLDCIDLRRRNLTRNREDATADIRNRYIRIASELRERGL